MGTKRPARGRRSEEQSNEPIPVAGRVPPHDLDAEASVLSALILENEIFDQVADILGDCIGVDETRRRHPKFYSPANGHIAAAFFDLRASGTPADITTVAAWLRSRDLLNAIGGAKYLAQLVDATPAVAHVADHARIVFDRWRQRETIGLCQRTAAEGYGATDAQTLLDEHATRLHELATAQAGTPMQQIGSGLMPALQRDWQRQKQGLGMMGRRSGIDAFDNKITGFHPGELHIVAARPGMGKAQPYDAKILTPTGWRRMGDLAVGDQVIGSNGKPCTVTGVFEQGFKKTWRVTLHGYTEPSTRCCDEHLWTAIIGGDPIVTTLETHDLRVLVKCARPVRLPVLNQDGGTGWHDVKSIEPDDEEPCRCIMVDAPDHLYVTDDFIITHNTSFALQIAVAIATPQQKTERLFEDPIEYGVPVFSLEMPREQLQTRMVCTEGWTDLRKYRAGQLEKADWDRLFSAGTVLSNLPIWIDDTPGITVPQLRAKVRQIQSSWCRPAQRAADGKLVAPERKVGAVIIDYLQLVGSHGEGDKREEVVASISRELKKMSKTLGVPVIALSQLNRSVETRGKDKRPQLSDLRESGAIEQDADGIHFLYREEYYYPGNASAKGICEIIIAKQRNGPTGKVLARFDGYCTRFSNLSAADAQAYSSDSDDE